MVEIENCPACHSDKTELYLQTKDYFLTGESFKIDKCSNCGLLFTNPRPEDDQLGSYYESEEYLSHDSKIAGLKDFLYGMVKKVSVRKKFSLVEEFSGKTEGRILDYGCGTGTLLNQFIENGWQTTGVEPNQKAAGFATKEYGLDIFSDLKDITSQQKFDVIMLWHVIEHLPYLHETIDKLKQMLSETGTLFIAFPNIESPDALKYRAYWAALDVPRHLYHFSKKSFSRFIKEHKFKIQDTLPMKFDSFYVSLLSEQYKKAGLLSYPKALVAGFSSNRKAKRNNNYSSLIFVLKQDKK